MQTVQGELSVITRCFECCVVGNVGLDPGVYGRFDLAALVQPHLKSLFVCLFSQQKDYLTTYSEEGLVPT